MTIVLLDDLPKTKKETGDSRKIYQNKLVKTYIQHDMVFWDLKNFPRRRASDKVLLNKAFNTAKNSKYDLQICTCFNSL